MTFTNWLKRWGFLVPLLFLLTSVALTDPANYIRAVANVLVSEGGARYTNHPNDPGGPTKYGITIHDVRKYLKPGASAADVRALTEQQARAIYRKHYADRIRFDELAKGVDYSLLDYTVISGPCRSIPDLKMVLGLRDRSCVVTDALVAAANADPERAVRLLNEQRLRFHASLGSWSRPFQRGWRNRTLSVRAISLAMTGVPKADLGGDLMMIPRTSTGRAWAGAEEPLEETEDGKADPRSQP